MRKVTNNNKTYVKVFAGVLAGMMIVSFICMALMYVFS